MQAGVGQLVTDVMRIVMIIALDIVITLLFSINCSTLVCLPIICVLLREKPLVKTMAPGLFSSYYFQIYKAKNTKIPCCNLLPLLYFAILFIFYTQLYQISSLQVTVKGLTTPLSHWVQVFVCLCRCNHLRVVSSFVLILGK